MTALKAIRCKLFGHRFKRARKDQHSALKYCACGATREVKRRKAAA